MCRGGWWRGKMSVDVSSHRSSCLQNSWPLKFWKRKGTPVEWKIEPWTVHALVLEMYSGACISRSKQLEFWFTAPEGLKTRDGSVWWKGQKAQDNGLVQLDGRFLNCSLSMSPFVEMQMFAWGGTPIDGFISVLTLFLFLIYFCFDFISVWHLQPDEYDDTYSTYRVTALNTRQRSSIHGELNSVDCQSPGTSIVSQQCNTTAVAIDQSR